MQVDLYNIWNRIKNNIYNFIQSRLFLLSLIFCILSAVLIQRLFYLQIVKGEEFFQDYKLQIQKTRKIQGTRGNIYDRNGTLLAYNELAYAVMIEDNGSYDSLAQKNESLNQVILKVIHIVERHQDSVINNFGIILDSGQVYQYAEQDETRKLRFIADVFGKRTIDELSSEQQSISAQDLMKYLCTDKINGYGISFKKHTPEEILKLVNIRYAISLNGYQKYIATTIADDVSDDTVAEIMENLDQLQGVSIEEESLRRYPKGNAFANVIGYTGQISKEEYESLSKEEKELYAQTDTIGKAGIEKKMDSVLQGKKGEEKLYVNSVGRVIDSEKGKAPTAGNNLYLTLDAELQEVTYHIIEQELAGILLAKIQNVLVYDREKVQEGNEVIIPISDVYHTLIDNDVVDMKHFSSPEGKQGEKEVYEHFQQKQKEVMTFLKGELSNETGKPISRYSKEEAAYIRYLVDTVYMNSLMKDRVDKKDKIYRSWIRGEDINPYTFLRYALSKNWMDTSFLKPYIKDGMTYSSAEELYQGMIDYGLDRLALDRTFDKMLYKYLIIHGTVTGRQLSMILLEQGVLSFDEGLYQGLVSGEVDAYSFIRSKIQSLELTPGQLALEPCTGSMVITDVNTGQVLASVSYPGYDNNRLVNTMDSTYYNKLVTDKSRPFYNNATQERTAPGSVYKPITAIAGLKEGVIDYGTYIHCNGFFDRVSPSPKCWIYPGAHGSLNVEGAIAHSCNIFFYEVGYQMSMEKKIQETLSGDQRKEDILFSNQKGTETLKKYAEKFGLNQVSGMEIPESEPQISDEYSVLSAIGQGTNNYTTSQLARYMTTLANKGKLYHLTLLYQETNPSGTPLKVYEPRLEREIQDIPPEMWNSVHSGLRQVVTSSYGSIFAKINASQYPISGKTGTAQQSRTHANHSLFAGYAPSQNPEIAFSIRIANGYGSIHAVEIGRHVMEYYYKITPEEDILKGQAFEVTPEHIVIE